MIVIQKRYQRVFRFAQFEAHLASLFTVLSGRKVISSRELMKSPGLQLILRKLLNLDSEIFGTSEDETPLLDYSEDPENGV